jgi:hypothetical protein
VIAHRTPADAVTRTVPGVLGRFMLNSLSMLLTSPAAQVTFG